MYEQAENMVLPVSSLLRKVPDSQRVSRRPLFNQIPTDTISSRLAFLRTDYRRFWRQFKQNSEIVAVLSVPITDILGDRPEWTTLDGKQLSSDKLRQAKAFWRNNRGKETTKGWLYDMFLTGDGYFWIGKPTSRNIKEATRRVLKNFPQKFTKLQVKELETKLVQDEVLKRPKKIDYVASSTVKVIHNSFEILGYEQISQTNTATFKPSEIIHGRYLNLDGKVNGFAPVESLAAEITLLWLVKGNMLSFMRNGGAPNKVFILPKEIAKSQNHQFLIEQLRKYKRIENRHGNLVFTGELTIQDLQGSPKDLEYKDLALYIASNIAFAYGIPVTRIPYLFGTSANKGDTGGLSESGYWNRISEMQDTIEDLLNSQLFEQFGWNIKFPRKYKQDEVREAQTASMNADTVNKYQNLLARNGLQMTVTKALSLINFSQEDVEAIDLKQFNNASPGSFNNQNMLGNDVLEREQDRQDSAQSRRNTVNSKGMDKAVANP